MNHNSFNVKELLNLFNSCRHFDLIHIFNIDKTNIFKPLTILLDLH